MESKEETIARIALGMNLNVSDTTNLARSILAALHNAYSEGFEAGFRQANKSHELAMAALEGALANRRPPNA